VTERVRVFVNERPLWLAAGTPVGEALAAHDPELGRALRDGTAYVTDGTGRTIPLSEPAGPGRIFRVVRSARRERREPA
jgi:hypothetical protein